MWYSRGELPTQSNNLQTGDYSTTAYFRCIQNPLSDFGLLLS